jgi:predicted nucleic acid-binding protein
MQRLFVDTSAWFAFIHRTDIDHLKIKNFLNRFQGTLITSNYVFDELVTLVLSRAYHAEAVKIGNHLRNPSIVTIVSVTEEDEEQSWDFFKKMDDKSYSFTDCTSFILMKRLGLTTSLSLDPHFEQAGFHRVP